MIAVAVLQISFAGWAKIIVKENNNKNSVTDYFKLKMFQKLFSQPFHRNNFLNNTQTLHLNSTPN